MQAIRVGYTTILHEPRINYGLSLNDYAVASLVYHLSTNPKAPVQGWCSAGREMLGKFLGLSRQTVITILKKLENINLVEINTATNFVKTTLEWYENFECFSVEQSALQGVKKLDTLSRNFTAGCKETLQQGCKESLHNNYNLHNDIDNNKYVLENFIEAVNLITKKKYKTISERGAANFDKLIKKGYTGADFEKAISEAVKARTHIESKFMYLTPEFFTRQDKLELYLNSNAEPFTGNKATNSTTPRNSDSGGKKEYD